MGNEEKKLGNFNGFDGGNYAGNVYSVAYVSPCLNTGGGGQRQPYIIERYDMTPNEIVMLGTMEGYEKNNRVHHTQGETPCVTGRDYKDPIRILEDKMEDEKYIYRVRKLTESECAKLMGLTSDDDKKAVDCGVSGTQRYKEYGNGIVTNCVQLIFEHLYKALYDENYVCTDETF